MKEQWQELKETITEMRDNGGKGTQQEVCKFLANLMGALEKQMQEPCEDTISRQMVLDLCDMRDKYRFDDFMCGEVDEDGTDIFLEMLKDKAERSK